MSKMIELTAAYDSTDPNITDGSLAKVLIDIDSIQSVTMKEEKSRYCEVSLVPSLPAYGESDEGETVVQDQRVLYVLEQYHEIRAVIQEQRGFIRCIQSN